MNAIVPGGVFRDDLADPERRAVAPWNRTGLGKMSDHRSNPFEESLEFESRRLAELHRYAILDTPPDGTFDDITHVAAKLFSVPIAIVSLVDADRVWFKSAHGLDGISQIDRGPGLCASAIMQDGVYVAEDLAKDPNSLANPLVARDNGFRFYAAQPLRGRGGYNLGTFCILDFVPRKFSSDDAKLLKSLAQNVMAQMDCRLESREIARAAGEFVQSNRFRTAVPNNGAPTTLPKPR